MNSVHWFFLIQDPEPRAISILFGCWGMFHQCGLCSCVFSPGISLKLIIIFSFFIFECLFNYSLHNIPGLTPYWYKMTRSGISILWLSFAQSAIFFFSVNSNITSEPLLVLQYCFIIFQTLFEVAILLGPRTTNSCTIFQPNLSFINPDLPFVFWLHCCMSQIFS